MVELNKHLKNGDHIIIPEHLSWQVDEEDLDGEWIIKKTYKRKFREKYFLLIRVDQKMFTHNMIYMDYSAAEFLSGYKVKRIVGKFLDPKKYQPALDEINSYITDDEKFGFFYCGRTLSDFRPIIDVDLLKNKWLYKK